MAIREGERTSVGKEVFMRARAGNISVSFPTEQEAQEWENRFVNKLKEGGYRVKEES